jgi:hypothetical protein
MRVNWPTGSLPPRFTPAQNTANFHPFFAEKTEGLADETVISRGFLTIAESRGTCKAGCLN